MRQQINKWLWRGAICSSIVFGIGVQTARAQDFFSQFFGGFERRVERSVERSYTRMPFASDDQGDEGYLPRNGGYSRRRIDDTPRYSSGGSQAFCVRTCDGRYFPISTQGEQSKAASCNSFCPKSETSVYYGSTIDSAVSEKGRRYSDLPNAFKFRTELVAGCTCNGTPTGLAPVKVENDPTLRKGDIVAGADGLMVTRSADRRGASLAFSPVSASIKAKFERAPVVASE